MTTENRIENRKARRAAQRGKIRYCAKQRRRSGSVITLTALSLVMLSGFAAMSVDYGRSVIVKNQLQRATDAAALAAVKYLPTSPDGARVAARYYAYQNGKTIVNDSDIIITNNNRVRVSAVQNVKYFFGPVIKKISGDVPAKTTAAIQLRDNFVPPYVVPIGVTPSTYEAHKDGSPVVVEGIRQNKTDLDISEFVLFDLRGPNGKSPAHMQNQLQWGSTYNEPTYVGGTETTLNAANISQAQKFEAGMLSRITAANASPWNDDGTNFTNIPAGSPRMMYFIVTPEQQAVNGNNNARVVGFVPVYVESMEINGSQMKIRIRFLPLNSGSGGGYTDANTSDPSNASFRISRLVD
ncbi:MAG TPA: pilus assembly protein TadG-related protein [Abditibacteriaceae bacterium]|jgi:Flp pilus assembly protein TadG